VKSLSARKAWTIIIVAIVAVGAWRSFVAVDETEYVLLTQFGRHIRTFAEPGLKGVFPWQSISRFDRRLQIYDPRPSEFLTSDPKNILLDIYVCWRIADPLPFLQRVTDKAGAEARLHDIVWAELAAEIGQCPLSALVSDEKGEMTAPEIMSSVWARCRDRGAEALSIEVVDVRLKRINLPQQNKQSVFDRMREERNMIAGLYRAEGEEEALKIRADADLRKTELLATARRDAALRLGEADRQAIQIYSAAHGKDPDFYRFLRSIETYQNILTSKTTLVLSAESELFRYLADPRGETVIGGKEKHDAGK